MGAFRSPPNPFGHIFNIYAKLYDHQKDTLQKIREQRTRGISSFLVVFPTASGKSKIIEEDVSSVLAQDPEKKILIIAPSKIIVEDWQKRAKIAWSTHIDNIFITTYAYMMQHYREYSKDHFSYFVVDEYDIIGLSQEAA